MAMLKRQVAITPPPQWVRVVGGFTAHQFTEKRLPTIDELNAVAPDTPVFLLHLYDRAVLNAAALRAVGYTKDTPDPPAGERLQSTKASSYGVFAWLSGLVSRLKRILEFAFGAGQGKLKYDASRLISACPEPAPVSIDNRSADRQPHPHPAGFRGVESLENALEIFRTNPRPRVAYRHEDFLCLILFRADQQLSCSRLNRAHCLNRVQDQVQDDLLQLNTIALNGSQPLRKERLD